MESWELSLTVAMKQWISANKHPEILPTPGKGTRPDYIKKNFTHEEVPEEATETSRSLEDILPQTKLQITPGKEH
eukprot:3852748-Ditylum_brightwellii.AAC.1